jgi:hypothetical protein
MLVFVITYMYITIRPCAEYDSTAAVIYHHSFSRLMIFRRVDGARCLTLSHMLPKRTAGSW